MSNILIIKHGSLGDIVQISGVLKDIKIAFPKEKIFILTTFPYTELLSSCPYIDGVLLDKRLPRWNIFYLIGLKKMISKFNFSQVFDLQNSSRTSFYRKYLFNIKNWSSTMTSLEKNEKKIDFDQMSVLKRFKKQLNFLNIKTDYTLIPDFNWSVANVDKIINRYLKKKFILVFPFCSPQLSHKKWPHYNDLIKLITSNNANVEIVVSPGPNEIEEAKKINALSILNNKKSLNIMELSGLIKKSSYVIANDTGPAHMAAHLGCEGVVLFGHHTTAEKVSVERENFKSISVDNLFNLSAKDVYLNIEKKIKLIN